MANQEHLDILKQGVEVWNNWREHNTYEQIDLTQADLMGINLSRANLSGVSLFDANLIEANLNEADLSDADLHGANLREANLSYATLYQAHLDGDDRDLVEADLSGANLRGAKLYLSNLTRVHLVSADLREAFLEDATLILADLSGVNLNKADLVGCDLSGADLSAADLNGADLLHVHLNGAVLRKANFSEARVGRTGFDDVDLSQVKGLASVYHEGPSTIGIDTIYKSHGNIPEAFLKGAGVDDAFITYIRSLVGKPIEYYSCFISYSSKDEAFAKRLYADLQSKNVRCWFAPEDLKWGNKIRTGIDEAIRLHDKLLLILSKSSVASGWVEREVKTAFSKERKEKRIVLFPIRVDGAVFDCPFEWATEIRHERNIGDFTHWKNHDDYEKAFNRLLRDLKAAS